MEIRFSGTFGFRDATYLSKLAGPTKHLDETLRVGLNTIGELGGFTPQRHVSLQPSDQFVSFVRVPNEADFFVRHLLKQNGLADEEFVYKPNSPAQNAWMKGQGEHPAADFQWSIKDPNPKGPLTEAVFDV